MDAGDNLFSVRLSVIYRITDLEHLKRRLHLSTVHKEMSVNLLHAKIPFVGLKRNNVSMQPLLDKFFQHLLPAMFFLPVVFITHCAVSLREPCNHKIILFLSFQWSTLCIDLVSFAGELFKGFLKLDVITLYATCKVRRIFTMKTEPKDDGNGVHHKNY